MRLTDVTVRSLKPPAGSATKQKTFFDDSMKGFGVRVSVGGAKSFVLMYGKLRKLHTIGRYPELSLAEARQKARLALGGLLTEDETPTAVKVAISFESARSRFLEDASRRNKASTFGEYRRLLMKHFNFDKQLDAITRQDVMDAVAELKSKPSALAHAFVAIRTLMNWAVAHGYLDKSPMPPLKIKATARSRVLTHEELAKVWHRAREASSAYGTIVQLLILTGQRRGEIAGLSRGWITQDAITFPQGFTKNRREHRIPLGAMAKKIIDGVEGSEGLLFPARGKSEKPYNGWSKAKRDFDAHLGIAPYTLHDLRRTFSSELAALGTPIHVTEKLLNHVSGTLSGVAAIYNRYTYADEMRAAVTAYETHIAKLVAA